MTPHLRTCAGAALLLLSGAASASSLTWTSAAGDTIGNGVGGTWTTPAAGVNVVGNSESFNLFFYKDGEFFSIELAAPRGETLRRGTYSLAERTGIRTGRSPGVDVNSNHGACNETWGSFQIREIEFGEGGAPSKLDAYLSMRCNSATAPLYTATILLDTPAKYATTVSAAGDPVGRGAGTKTHRGHTSDIVLAGSPAGLSYGLSGLRDEYYLAIQPPFDKTIAKGTFPISRVHGPDTVGIYLTHSFEACDDVSGTLKINNVTWSDDQVAGLNAVLTAYCNGATVPFKLTIRHGL
jgi:hypothetical protein